MEDGRRIIDFYLCIVFLDGVVGVQLIKVKGRGFLGEEI
jgi:hypothetical protein